MEEVTERRYQLKREELAGTHPTNKVALVLTSGQLFNY